MPRRQRHIPTEQDFLALQETVYEELKSTQDRVRNLIGSRHWQTDGEHKEEILRNVLRLRLPDDVRIGKGFVCVPSEQNASRNKSSGQIDILITAGRGLTLHRQGDLVFVTADTVNGIIEVKTELRRQLPRLLNGRARPLEMNRAGNISVITKLANQVQLIRENGNTRCWAGLFVYEQGNIEHGDILRALQIAANGNEQRAIDCVALGPNIFVHYWSNGRREADSPVNGPVWHSYNITRLAPAYFVNNIAIHVSPETPYAAQQAWFPIEGGKETRRYHYAPLDGNKVYEF